MGLAMYLWRTDTYLRLMGGRDTCAGGGLEKCGLATAFVRKCELFDLTHNRVFCPLSSLSAVTRSSSLWLLLWCQKQRHSSNISIQNWLFSTLHCSLTYRITRHVCTIFFLPLRETIEELAKRRHLWQYWAKRGAARCPECNADSSICSRGCKQIGQQGRVGGR